jgi:hypothetical protein
MEAALHTVVRLMDGYVDTLSQRLDVMEGWVNVTHSPDAAVTAAAAATVDAPDAGGGTVVAASVVGTVDAAVTAAIVHPAHVAARRAQLVTAARKLALELLPAIVPVPEPGPEPGPAADNYVYATWLRNELRRLVDAKLGDVG